MITLFSWFIQGGYVPGLILDPDKGIEQAVYAKNKGIDYSYADTASGLTGNLGLEPGKGELKFCTNFYVKSCYEFSRPYLKEEKQSSMMLRILLTIVTMPLSKSLVNLLQKNLPRNQNQ